jgi:hypothetical protein
VIKDEDVEFHETDKNQPNWAETNYFGFFNAEAKLNVGVYGLFRPNLGIVGSTICINSGFANAPWEADFIDMQSSLPAPDSLRHYRLNNSLEVECTRPNMDWTIKYDDGEGTTINVDYKAIMLPFDIQDPDMDPMKAKALAQAEKAGNFAWGTAYNGHFDQSGHFKGRVTVRGQEYPIDCVSTMDHSWGPRPERGAPNMSWLHAHFSKDLAIHAIFSFDPEENGKNLSLTHGYVAEKGQIYGLKEGTGVTVRRTERYADTVELRLIDKDDREWVLTAKGLTTFPWLCWPNMVTFNVLAEWQCNGLTGHGEIMDFFEAPQLTRLNSNGKTRRKVGVVV